VEFLLDCIELPPVNDDADAVPDVFVKLLLAFNLHFELPADNLVMSAIAGRGTAKTFTEKLMLLFNREGRESSFHLMVLHYWLFSLSNFHFITADFSNVDVIARLFISSGIFKSATA